MALSVFDLFSIGIGPSSSHTVGPMRAAHAFAHHLQEASVLPRVGRVRCELFGSLGATGHGHGSPNAVILGLLGETPETVDPTAVVSDIEVVRRSRRLQLLRVTDVDFDVETDLVLHRRTALPAHPNGMRLHAYDVDGHEMTQHTYYSVGGGFIRKEAADGSLAIEPDTTDVAFPFKSGAALLQHTQETGLSIAGLMVANERAWRPENDVRRELLTIWSHMQACVRSGLASTEPTLPGGLQVPRRAPGIHRQLQDEATDEHLRAMDWLTLWALAVNEENAAGGRVVTAPTNGAAGIIPAVLHYVTEYCDADEEGIVDFLLTAGAIGIILKQQASISGAEVGCQGEVGSACAMAAAGLAAVLGGTPQQVENAAEIGLEHNLGLTCDPVGGLVQIPCIERNAIAAVKAVTAARTALRGNGVHIVSLDKVIKTMKETGADMSIKYKETARGGLAVNVIEC